MGDHFTVEELVADDSFISYCFQRDETDCLYWEHFVQEHADDIEKIEEAKQIVLGLHVMLKQEHAENKRDEFSIQEEAKPVPKIISLRKIVRYAAAVAAVFILFFIGKELVSNSREHTMEPERPIVQNKTGESILSYKTSNGERRMITLSDKTKIWLNSDSHLRISSEYGEKKREVYLDGEALFDVIHNNSLPFIVHTERYAVMDLGTVFNVKAYKGDVESETSLIKGKVEITVANSERKILLSPNQKVIINGIGEVNPKEKMDPVAPETLSVTLSPLSYSRDSTVIETAWVQNRLEIVDESLYEMKEKLERWFDVNITIKDSSVGEYPFTATFEKENIEQVLKALQYAYHFNYKIKDNDITISK